MTDTNETKHRWWQHNTSAGVKWSRKKIPSVSRRNNCPQIPGGKYEHRRTYINGRLINARLNEYRFHTNMIKGTMVKRRISCTKYSVGAINIDKTNINKIQLKTRLNKQWWQHNTSTDVTQSTAIVLRRTDTSTVMVTTDCEYWCRHTRKRNGTIVRRRNKRTQMLTREIRIKTSTTQI